MLRMSASAKATVLGSYVLHTRVQSWLGDRLLGELPVTAGSESVDRSSAVPERLSLTVPAEDLGRSWVPTKPTDALAPLGQRLRVSLGVELANGMVEWIERGWYLIQSAGRSRDTVRIEAAGLLSLLDEARLIQPIQTTTSTTILEAIRALCSGALPVLAGSLPADRAIGAVMTWDDDRLKGVHELLDIWPAGAITQPGGYLEIVPTSGGTSVLSLTDGVGGTVIEWGSQMDRDGTASVAVARGEAPDGGQIQGVVYDQSATSPTRWGSWFSPLQVPVTMDSQGLTTLAQCQAAAAALLARTQRTYGRKLTAEIVPHPGLQIGDGVTINGAGLTLTQCSIESLSMPLTPNDGSMTLGLVVI